MSTSLLINVFINNELKFNHFIKTFSDIFNIFDEIHIKVRGLYKHDCLKFVRSKKKEKLYIYQYLDEKDWVSTTLEIVCNITSNSIFLYNEDHMLNCRKSYIRNVIKDFNNYKLDFISYSFYRASKLTLSNILPLEPRQNKYFNYFVLNKKKLNLIGKISPSYYYINLISIFSKEYLRFILSSENFIFKLYLNNFNRFIAKLLPSKRRYFYNFLNQFLSKLNLKLCLYPPNTPFNIERVWYENGMLDGNWKYGILTQELFTNYDDDNGHSEESLIKRGLYPFKNKYFLNHLLNRKDLLSKFSIDLKKGEEFDCTYFSSKGRINICPVLCVETLIGSVDLLFKDKNLIYRSKNKLYIFSNIKNKLIAQKDSRVQIMIFDEIAN